MHTAYSDNREMRSVLEMARGAKRAGFDMIAITDHLRLIPEASVFTQYLADIKAAEKKVGIRVFPGLEVCILRDAIDWAPFAHGKRLVIVASCHDISLELRKKEVNRDILIRTIKDKRVDIIGHPLRSLVEMRLPMFDVKDTDAIIRALHTEYTKKHRIAIELNGGDERRGFTRDPAYRAFYHRCKKAGVLFSMGSDAHALKDVASLPYDLIKELDLPKEQIFVPT